MSRLSNTLPDDTSALLVQVREINDEPLFLDATGISGATPDTVLHEQMNIKPMTGEVPSLTCAEHDRSLSSQERTYIILVGRVYRSCWFEINDKEWLLSKGQGWTIAVELEILPRYELNKRASRQKGPSAIFRDARKTNVGRWR